MSERDSIADLYVMNANGTNVQRLTHTPVAEDDPAWSPDGSRIAFEKCVDFFGCARKVATIASNLVGPVVVHGEGTAPTMLLRLRP